MTFRKLLLLILAIGVVFGAAGALAVPRALHYATDHTALQRCHRLGAVGPQWQLRCTRQAVRRQIDERGVAALPGIEAFALRDDLLRGRCHSMMHFEGRRASERVPGMRAMQKLVDAVGASVADCSAGFLHGVFEGYVEKNGLRPADSARFRSMCSGQSARLVRFNCAHGLGHAVMREMRLDVAKSARFCTGLPAADAGDCESALAMTLAEGVDFEGGPLAAKKTVPEMARYCEGLPGNVRSYCFRWIPITKAWVPRMTVSHVAKGCARPGVSAPDRLSCMIGIGRSAFGASGSRVCGTLTSQLDVIGCRYGFVVGDAINRPRADIEGLARWCAGSRMPSEAPCALAVGRMSSVLVEKGASASDVCGATWARQDRRWCRAGRDLERLPLDFSRQEQDALRAIARDTSALTR